MEVKLVDPLGDSEWDRLAILHPDFSFFHHAAWAKVLSATYGHSPNYLHCSESGALVALFPIMEVRSLFTGLRGVCLPFVDSCAPLIFAEGRQESVLRNVLEMARIRNWKHLEVRGANTFWPSGKPSMTYCGHALDLRGGPDKLFARFTSSVRRAIRKAERSKVKAQVTQTRDAMFDFYRLHVLTRRRHGLPPQPQSFFLSIYENVIKKGLGFVVLAGIGSRLIAGAVFFLWQKKAIYKFGASDESFQQSRGNNLVMWEGIQFLASRGVDCLHFGRTAPSNHGLRRFKIAWGAEEETVNYFRIDPKTGRTIMAEDKTVGFHNTMFRRLPLVANRLLGAMIYPHLD